MDVFCSHGGRQTVELWNCSIDMVVDRLKLWTCSVVMMVVRL